MNRLGVSASAHPYESHFPISVITALANFSSRVARLGPTCSYFLCMNTYAVTRTGTRGTLFKRKEPQRRHLASVEVPTSVPRHVLCRSHDVFCLIEKDDR